MDNLSAYVETTGSTKIRFVLVSGTPGVAINCTNATSVTGTGTVVLTGKTKSKYQKQHLITLEKPFSTYSIRMSRITADNLLANIQNDLFMDSYTEVVNSQLTYPNSVVVSTQLDSRQLSSLPARSYLVRGLLVRVPSNYTPETRAYTGVWDGTFTTAVTSCPAWVLFDVLTNKRYGLGRFIDDSQVDTAMLYSIGRYCDAVDSTGVYVGVPTGFGTGREPRFTINTVINSIQEAYKLVSDITSVFRGMGFWMGSSAAFLYDHPTDPSMVYTNANVKDGLFSYTGSARKDRHSVVNVTWNDPEDGYKQGLEYVEDPEQVQKFGVRKLDTLAFGCTSRGQAHRVGLWMLYSERYETDFITFQVGLDSSMIMPGEVVKIHDQFRSGRRMGGRVLAVTSTGATLDSPITLLAGGAVVTFQLQDGTLIDRTVLETAGAHSAVTWSSALPSLPALNTMFVLSEVSLEPLLARVLSIQQVGIEKSQFTITAVEHFPTKFNSIEEGWELVIPRKTVLDNGPPDTPTNLTVVEDSYQSGPSVLTKLVVSWDHLASGSAVKWVVNYRYPSGSGTWQGGMSNTGQYEIPGAVIGQVYDIRVQSVSGLGVTSSWLLTTHAAVGKTTGPTNYDVFDVTFTLAGEREVSFAYSNVLLIPKDLAGARIKWIAGTYSSGSWPSWASMTPWFDGLLTSGFESMAVPAGPTCVAIVAVNTSGVESSSPVYLQRTFPIALNSLTAPTLTLTYPTEIVVYANPQATSSTDPTLSFTATPVGVSGTAVFTCTAYNAAGVSLGGITMGGTGNTRTLTPAQFNSLGALDTDYVQIVATLGALSDQVTVYRLDGGTDAIHTLLTNEACVVPADTGGTVSSFAGASSDVKIYQGITESSSLWTFTATVSAVAGTFNGSALPVSTGFTGVTAPSLVVTGLSADSGYVTITATRTGYPTQTKIFNISKSKAGVAGLNGTRTAVLDMYQWASATPTTFPSGTSTYTWATAQFTAPATLNGWSLTPGSGSPGQTLYGCDTSFADTLTTATSAVTWAASFAYPMGGTGVNGTRTAVLKAYQWAASAPVSFPSGVSTYTWATGAWTGGTLGSWTAAPGSSVLGQTLWMTEQTYSDALVTGTSAVSWSAATALAVGGAGANGSRTAVLELYQWAAVAPTSFPAGSSTYTWATAGFTTPATLNSWSALPGAPVLGQTLWGCEQDYSDTGTTATTAITWSTTTAYPVGASGSNGTRTGVMEVYQWAASAPTTFPAGTSTYTWLTGAFTTPATLNGWSLLPGAAVPGQTLWGCETVYGDTGTSLTTVLTWTASVSYPLGGAGTNGSNGKTYTLSVDGGVRNVTYDAAGGTPLPGQTAFSCTLYENGASVTPATWAWTANGHLSGTSSTSTFTPACAGTFTASANDWVKLVVTYAGQTVAQVIPIAVTKIGATGGTGAPGSTGAPGADGAEGTKSVTVTSFQWSNTGSCPAYSGTFNLTWPGTVSSQPSGGAYGWSASASTSPGSGYTLYMISKIVSDTLSAGVTYSQNWATASPNIIGFTQTGAAGSPGSIGIQGPGARKAYIVMVGSAVPGVPATYSGDGIATTAVTGAYTPGYWTTSLPTVPTSTSSATYVLWLVDGTYHVAGDSPSNQTTWGTPYLSTFKVDSLQAISANLGFVKIASVGALYSDGHTYGDMSTAGFFLGYSGGWKFEIGDSTQYMRYNGALSIVGGSISASDISASSFATATGAVTRITINESNSGYIRGYSGSGVIPIFSIGNNPSNDAVLSINALSGVGMMGIWVNADNQQGSAIRGTNNSAAADPYGVSAGVMGIGNGNPGVLGYNPSGGTGVRGLSASGFGVHGTASSGMGVYGVSSGANPGIFGTNTGGGAGIQGAVVIGYGCVGLSTSGIGVYGKADTTEPGVHGKNVGTGVGVQGNSESNMGVYGLSTSGPGVTGNSTSYIGMAGVSFGGTGYGVWGQGTTYDFYAGGSGVNYGPFTGAHDALIPRGTTIALGDIVVDVLCVARRNISNTIFKVSRSTSPSQVPAGVMVCNSGLLSRCEPSAFIESNGTGPEDKTMSAEYELVKNDYTLIQMNALGEGQVSVCGENGDLAAGDLIATSRTPGKGMKQDDNVIRNYTVAKAREPVVFGSPSEVKLVACIYLCG